MNKEVLATIFGMAGLSLLKKVSGSRNNEKPFAFAMTFYLEGEDGFITESQYNRTIAAPEWLNAVDGFIKGTNDFIRYGDEDAPAQMLLEYREYLEERNPTYIGEVIDQWLTGYMYEQGEWEEYANTIDDVAIQWTLPDYFRVLKSSGPDGQDQVMFTYYLSLDEIINLTKKTNRYKNTLKKCIELALIINIEDWINVHWRELPECEVFVTETKLEVDMSLIEPSKRKIVKELTKENPKSQLRRF